MADRISTGLLAFVGCMSVASLATLWWSIHRAPPHRGNLGEECLPDGTCAGAALYCRHTLRLSESFECWVKEER